MKHKELTNELIDILDKNTMLKELLIKSIKQARQENPNKDTNPISNLEDFFNYLDFANTCMPWGFYRGQFPDLYEDINQTLGIFYYIFEQPLDELSNNNYLNNTLCYVPELKEWVNNYINSWGMFLNTEASWSEEVYNTFKQYDRFGLNKGWYESPSNWKCFNDFFSRKLIDKSVRPVCQEKDILVFPADSEPQGIWHIDEQSNVIIEDADCRIKTGVFNSLSELLVGSKYQNSFSNGVLTHTFLDIDDYHRYHFPISGEVKEVLHIPGLAAPGGFISYDQTRNMYVEKSDDYGWQKIETRGLIVLDTDDCGLVAILPVGMCQICSVVFSENVKVGNHVSKGDDMGCFLFGGSDIIIVFQKDIDLEMINTKHCLMGEPYAKILKRS